jgi:hypothetical protein
VQNVAQPKSTSERQLHVMDCLLRINIPNCDKMQTKMRRMLLVVDRCFKMWQIGSRVGKLFIVNRSCKRWQDGSRSGKNDVYCRLVIEIQVFELPPSQNLKCVLNLVYNCRSFMEVGLMFANV